MSSVIYVHTHRFYTEIVTFFNNFNQLQNVMNRIREAAAGAKVSQGLPRGLRIKLDIEAGSPLLLLPMSSHSSQILLVDLGKPYDLFLINGNRAKCIWVTANHQQ